MALEISTFNEDHLEPASRLLAAEQKRRRMLDAALPAVHEAAEAARKPLEEAFRTPAAAGVVAYRGGDLVAFLLALPRLPARSMGIPFHCYAIGEGEPLETYRELYAELADRWVRRGFFNHTVLVLDGDRALRDLWDSLGFGRWLTTAIRSVAEPVSDPPELDIRELGTDSLDVITALEAANARHHNSSPIFIPYLPEDREMFRTRTEAMLEDPANAHFVAYEDGEPAGMNTFMTESRHSPLLQPERDIYLFQGIVYEPYRHAGIGRGLLAHSMRWARDHGYTTCSLHFFSANISGARFWTNNGFRPAAHVLSRHIDERIAWARPD